MFKNNFQEHSYDTKDHVSTYFHVERSLKRVTGSTLTLSEATVDILQLKMLKNLSPGLLSVLAMELGDLLELKIRSPWFSVFGRV